MEAELGGVSADSRLQAVKRIAAISPAPFLPPDELRRLIDDAHGEEIAQGLEGR